MIYDGWMDDDGFFFKQKKKKVVELHYQNIYRGR